MPGHHCWGYGEDDGNNTPFNPFISVQLSLTVPSTFLPALTAARHHSTTVTFLHPTSLQPVTWHAWMTSCQGVTGGEGGPSEWYRYYPIAQGNRQSPINIVSGQAAFNSSLNPLVLSYDQCTSVNISNNGHSVVVEFEDYDDKTVISGGPLSNSYRLKQFHFHWGNQHGEGSEHTVDGKSYPCELHLVHWNAKAYATFGEAAGKPDGLAVIGIFLDTGGQHPGINRLTDALYMVKFKGTQAQFDNFNPKCLLPSSLEFWTYPGSLTTPPLNESVIWIVLKESIKVSEKQMDKFRKTLLFSGEEEGERMQMVNNFRPPQPLNGRKVQASFKG
uniref:Carbonic anhydrase n=1 Tax=Leptobrachium leishanense TaxID=445787 RepID=A0A8C5PNB8_9ANUR